MIYDTINIESRKKKSTYIAPRNLEYSRQAGSFSLIFVRLEIQSVIVA